MQRLELISGSYLKRIICENYRAPCYLDSTYFKFQLFHTNNNQRRTRPSDIRVRTKYNLKPSNSTPFGKYIQRLTKLYQNDPSPKNSTIQSATEKKYSENPGTSNLKLESIKNSTRNFSQPFQIEESRYQIQVIGANKGQIIDYDEKLKNSPANSSIITLQNDSIDLISLEKLLEQTKAKNLIHKKLWLCLKRRQWDQWDNTIEQLRASQLIYDEVSYTLLLHGYIISPKHNTEEALEILNEMRQAKIHPSLIHLNETLINFYTSLNDFNVIPNDKKWRSILRSSWLIAALVKRRREKAISYQIAILRQKIAESPSVIEAS